MSKKILTPAEVPCLWGAGAFGHTWLTLLPDAETGGERLSGQCSDGATAYRWWQENGERGRILTRKGKGWVEVRPSAACIS